MACGSLKKSPFWKDFKTQVHTLAMTYLSAQATCRLLLQVEQKSTLPQKKVVHKQKSTTKQRFETDRKKLLVKYLSFLILWNWYLFFQVAFHEHGRICRHKVGLCALAFSVFFSFILLIIKCVHFSDISLFALEIAQK